MCERVAAPLQEPAMNETDSREKPIESALVESTRLREENARLRRVLAEHGIPIPVAAMSDEAPSRVQEQPSKRTAPEKASQRIALFRSLFRGRNDAYAVRWEQPNGRTGYTPKADRDWRAYLEAEESDRRKVDRQTRKFRPLTDDVDRRRCAGTLDGRPHDRRLPACVGRNLLVSCRRLRQENLAAGCWGVS